MRRYQQQRRRHHWNVIPSCDYSRNYFVRQAIEICFNFDRANVRIAFSPVERNKILVRFSFANTKVEIYVGFTTGDSDELDFFVGSERSSRSKFFHGHFTYKQTSAGATPTFHDSLKKHREKPKNWISFLRHLITQKWMKVWQKQENHNNKLAYLKLLCTYFIRKPLISSKRRTILFVFCVIDSSAD